jgi:hypothetical protein
MRRVVTGSFRDSVITNAVRNAGAYPFRVDTVIVQGPDAAAFSRVSGGVRSVIAPGADHAIEMRFRPLRVGTHRADLLIVTSSDTLVHTIRGEGVLEAASVAPTVIDMGTVRIGARKDSARAIIVRNRSTGAVRVRSITPRGADLTSFTVTGTVPRVIPAGGVAEYDVAFAPFTTNRTACTFQIDVDVDGGPFSVQVVGKGTQEGAAITVIPPRTVLRCEADTIDTVRIGNTGTRDLVVRSAVFSGPHAVDYAMLTTFPRTIVPGDTLAAAFLVAPTDAGVRVASLTIEHSEGAPIVVPIDARKDSGAAQFVERVIDIGTVCSGVTIDTSVVIANPGTVDVTATLAGQGVEVTPTVSVPAGDSIRVPVRLTMSASTGVVDIVLTATEEECGHVSIMRFIGRADTSVVRVPAEIDLGTVCGDADVLSTLIITNRASASVQAALRASASITIDTSTMLAPRSATVVSFTWSGRGRAGTIADTIIVRDEACGVDHPVIIRADVISAAIAADPIVDVGPHLVGTIVRDTLLIVNIGPVPVRVPAPQGIAGPLTLVDLVPPAGTMLMPNDTARAVIDVLVTLGDGERTVTWPVVEPCSQNLVQRVRWTGGTADTVRTAVWIDDVTGAAGERAALRLRMSAEAADPSRLPTAYQAEIRVNPTCMISTDPSITCVSDTPDGCTYTIVGSRSTSDTLITIPVLITLGTTDRSPLEVQSFMWTDPRATTIVTTTNGTLTVEGICEEGGVRLFVPTGVSLSCVVRPNPASDVATVEYGCVESGLVTMEIIDAQGRVVLTPLASVAVTTGVYVRSVDVATLPNGVYFVRLSTPSDVLVTRFDIVR